MTLSLKNVYAGYEKNANVLYDISCEFEKGSVSVVIGSNGCGKSTLLKVLSRQIKPSQGNAYLNDKDLSEYPLKALAREIAVLPQVRNVPSIPAAALVTHGRFPYMSFPRIPSTEDKKIVRQCMLDTDTLQFADKDVSALSGGQRQRVYIAMLLAQQTDVILLDEPTTFLDVGCQFEVLDMIRSLKEKGKCIVLVLHDISQALQIADKIILLDEGNNVFCGTPDELIQSHALEEHMRLTPHKVEDNGNTVYYFTKTE